MRRTRRQAFRQAPWRTHLRLTSGAAMPLIALLVVAGMYLAVNARVADAGREVLTLERRREELQRVHGELATRLAQSTSPMLLMERAASMGFHPAGPHEIEYVIVEGYAGPPAFSAPRPPSSGTRGMASPSPAFTETWGEWLTRRLAELTTPSR